jgi:hypothetical protein
VVKARTSDINGKHMEIVGYNHESYYIFDGISHEWWDIVRYSWDNMGYCKIILGKIQWIIM